MNTNELKEEFRRRINMLKGDLIHIDKRLDEAQRQKVDRESRINELECVLTTIDEIAEEQCDA